jgi:hypothetical protein
MTGVSVEVPRYKNVAQTTGPPNFAISRRETGSTTGPGDILSYNIGVEDTILAMARASTVHYKRRLHCHDTSTNNQRIYHISYNHHLYAEAHLEVVSRLVSAMRMTRVSPAIGFRTAQPSCTQHHTVALNILPMVGFCTRTDCGNSTFRTIIYTVCRDVDEGAVIPCGYVNRRTHHPRVCQTR